MVTLYNLRTVRIRTCANSNFFETCERVKENPWQRAKSPLYNSFSQIWTTHCPKNRQSPVSRFEKMKWCYFWSVRCHVKIRTLIPEGPKVYHFLSITLHLLWDKDISIWKLPKLDDLKERLEQKTKKKHHQRKTIISRSRDKEQKFLSGTFCGPSADRVKQRLTPIKDWIVSRSAYLSAESAFIVLFYGTSSFELSRKPNLFSDSG